MESPSLQRMREVADNPSAYLTALKKKTGRPVIGLFHPVVPAELYYAAGVHPVRLMPYCDDPISGADDIIPEYLCSHVRAIWDQMRGGRYPFLDGIVIPRSCDAITCIYPTWKRHNTAHFCDYLNPPWKITENTLQFFVQELGRLKTNLDKFTGKAITDTSLQDAIAVYNEHRLLMAKVFDLMKADSPSISGTELQSIVTSGLIMDTKEHSQLLSAFLREVPARLPPRKPEVRLLISGACIDEADLMAMIESKGAMVVANDTHFGIKAVGVPVGKNSLEGLAEAYAAITCGFNASISDRFNYISGLAQEYKVDGVLFALHRTCEVEKLAYPELNRKIKEELRLPTLNIEVEYKTALAPLRTRVEAFIETLTRN